MAPRDRVKELREAERSIDGALRRVEHLEAAAKRLNDRLIHLVAAIPETALVRARSEVRADIRRQRRRMRPATSR